MRTGKKRTGVRCCTCAQAAAPLLLSTFFAAPQVGYKRMLYMCLHAESVLDLIEKPQT